MASSSPLSSRFKNIDEPDVFTSCLASLKLADTRNFVIEFGDAEAYCAIDLKKAEFDSLLKNPRVSSRATRWINFWGGDLQKDLIKTVVAHYGLSPRLTALLCSAASDKDTRIHVTGKDADSDQAEYRTTSRWSKKVPKDAEKANAYQVHAEDQAKKPKTELKNSTFGEIVDNIWHFCSVDWGQGSLHIGYNALYSIPGIEVESGPSKPPGKRIWTSLVLCQDGTVISISEKPFPSGKVEPKILEVVRRQVLNAVYHLSKVSKTSGHESLLTAINIRNFDQKSPEGKASSSFEYASLLFYYLFEDLASSYSLAAREAHPCGEKLENLRKAMFDKADMELVAALHLTGRQISVLKRIYQSLELIINRILQRQRLLDEESRRTARIFGGSQYDANRHDDDSSHLNHSMDFAPSRTEGDSFGVRLSSSSIVRFERLLDRLRLYALSEIDEYLAEKEALVLMNFNLIALKEAQTVEKLTRITVVLAKGTLLFLPVSLMTAYFSTQIRDLQNVYTARTYWLSFMVVVVISMLFLISFEIASYRIEGKTVYRSLTKTAWIKTKGKRA